MGQSFEASLVTKLNTDEIGKEILKAAAEGMNELVNRSEEDLLRGVKTEAVKQLQNSDTFKALQGGDLAELLEIPQSDVDFVLQAILDSVAVQFTTFKQRGFGFTGGVFISVLSQGLDPILASIRDEVVLNQAKNWLRWLLKDGNNVAVFNFGIDFEKELSTIDHAIDDIFAHFGLNRTQDVFIKQHPTAERGILFIPIQYQGTEGDNFITRALDGVEKSIEVLLQGIFK